MMGRLYMFLWVLCLPLAVSRAADGGAVDSNAHWDERSDSTRALAWNDALALVLGAHPELRAARFEARARHAEARQAGARRNPTIAIEAEAFGGVAARRKFDAAEGSLRATLPLDLLGARGLRAQAARFDAESADATLAETERGVVAEALRLFHAVGLAQERMALAREFLELARGSAEATRARVTAGRVSPVEETKAAIAVQEASIEVARAELDLERARRALAL
ncbi:MAG: TolC family protein, partial [Candidatus Eisenbacteria bacterium]